MKNILIAVLSVCLLLSMTGCARPHTSTHSTSTTDITTDPTYSTGDVHVAQKPMIAISVPVVTETETAPDGSVIFNHTYQSISLVIPDPNVADKVILDFLNRIDQTANDAASIRAAAKADYTSGKLSNPYLCQITYNPIRVDPGILSLFGSYASYSGTPHPETIYLSVNYDLLTGKVLGLNDIITDGTSGDTLYQCVVDNLTAQNHKGLYIGFQESVKARFQQGFANDASWYLSPTGLCFYFSPYEIAPYASGVIVAEIPYEQLPGILEDAYFPAEQESAGGTVFVDKFEPDNLEAFTQFSELILKENGDKILLHTNSAVQHIRIETGSWNANGTVFTPEQTVFAACGLTPGDAIMVQAQLDDKLPTLLLTYHANGKTVQFYISKDGSSPILKDA